MRRLGFAAALISAAGLGLGACGGDDDTTAAGAGGGAATGATSGTTATSTGTGSQAVPCDGAPADLSLAGTWAAYGRLSITLAGAPGGAITICPADQVGEANLLLMITMDQSGAMLSNVTATLCSLDLPIVTALVGTCDPQSQSLVTTQIVVPDALLDALPNILTTAVGGTVGGTEPGAGVSLERIIVNVGTSKSGDMMPSWNVDDVACGANNLGRTAMCETMCVDDCASLRDDDVDGAPGVTAQVCGYTPDDATGGVPCNADTPSDPGSTLQGKAFLDIQVDPQFNGSAVSSCELAGTVDTHVNYNVVGADVYLAGAQISVTSAIKSLPSFAVTAADSKFRMVRIDGQYGAPDWAVDPSMPVAACATIKANVNQLQ